MSNLVRELNENLSLSVLNKIAKEHNISVFGMKKSDIAKAVVDSLPEKVRQLLDDFRYAGRTAVSWFKVFPPEVGGLGSVQKLRKTLIAFCGNNPFKQMLKPKLTSKPVIVFGKIFSKQKMMCQFAHLETREAIINYEPKEVEETVFTYSFIRLPSFFEIRASSVRAKRIAQLFGDCFDVPELKTIELDDGKLNDLIAKLKGELVVSKKKHTSGDFDTTEVVAAPNLDLKKSRQFKTRYSKLPSRRQVILFDFKEKKKKIKNIKMQINPTTGSFLFRSDVPEQVIDYVFSKIRNIKWIR